MRKVMSAKRLREESGYTLVEVMVSIIILAIAILPMVGMFDMGINSATESSHYEKACTLANLKMEEAKSLPFNSLRNNFPVNSSTPNPSGYYDSGFISETGPASADFPDPPFQYRVQKQYMQQPPKDDSGLDLVDPTVKEFAPCDPDPTYTSTVPSMLTRMVAASTRSAANEPCGSM